MKEERRGRGNPFATPGGALRATQGPPCGGPCAVAARAGRPRAGTRSYLVSMKVSSESSRASHHFVWCTGACTPVTGDTCEWSR